VVRRTPFLAVRAGVRSGDRHVGYRRKNWRRQEIIILLTKKFINWLVAKFNTFKLNKKCLGEHFLSDLEQKPDVPAFLVRIQPFKSSLFFWNDKKQRKFMKSLF
jgi:hypothetical protein